MKTIRYMRRPEVLNRIGASNSTLFNWMNDSIFVPPVKLGARAVGWIEYEVDEVLAAMAAGKSRAELKKMVKELVVARKELIKAGGA